MDPFTITIIIIFSSTFVAGYLKSTLKDRCMKDFQRFPVIASMKNGKTIWGKFLLESTGFFLQYDSPHCNIDHEETGFIIYKPEYQTLSGIFRLVSDLSQEDRKRRGVKSLVFKQGWLFSIRKCIRNFFAAVRDAITDTFSLFLGKFAMRSSIISQNQVYMKKVGEGVFDYVGNSYDPVLERLVGSWVVVEIFRGGKWFEYLGILRNYTKDFVEVISIRIPLEIDFNIYGDRMESFGFSFEYSGGLLRARNERSEEISVSFDDSEKVCLESGKDLQLSFDERPRKGTIVINEELDAILPRSEAIVRHTMPGRRIADESDSSVRHDSQWDNRPLG